MQLWLRLKPRLPSLYETRIQSTSPVQRLERKSLSMLPQSAVKITSLTTLPTNRYPLSIQLAYKRRALRGQSGVPVHTKLNTDAVLAQHRLQKMLNLGPHVATSESKWKFQPLNRGPTLSSRDSKMF